MKLDEIQAADEWSYFEDNYPYVVGNRNYFGEDWQNLILETFIQNEEHLVTLNELLGQLKESGEMMSPLTIEIAWAFTKLTPLDKVHTIIIGQDPSPDGLRGDGLAYSIPDHFQYVDAGRKRSGGIPEHSSLWNMVLEIDQNFADSKNPPRFNMNKCGSLKNWAKQGILLLNTCLTREHGNGDEKSHRFSGWEEIVAYIIRKIIHDANAKQRGVVIIFTGASASWFHRKHLTDWIDDKLNLALTVGHPSPNNEHGGFFDSQVFKKASDFLKPFGIDVDWSICY